MNDRLAALQKKWTRLLGQSAKNTAKVNAVLDELDRQGTFDDEEVEFFFDFPQDPEVFRPSDIIDRKTGEKSLGLMLAHALDVDVRLSGRKWNPPSPT